MSSIEKCPTTNRNKNVKYNFSNKLITQIEVDGKLIKEQKEILNAEKKN